jgi:hypothetical protein
MRTGDLWQNYAFDTAEPWGFSNTYKRPLESGIAPRPMPLETLDDSYANMKAEGLWQFPASDVAEPWDVSNANTRAGGLWQNPASDAAEPWDVSNAYKRPVEMRQCPASDAPETLDDSYASMRAEVCGRTPRPMLQSNTRFYACRV